MFGCHLLIEMNEVQKNECELDIRRVFTQYDTFTELRVELKTQKSQDY